MFNNTQPCARSRLLVLVLPGPPSYRTYHNARFGYHLHYPGALRPQPEPANGTYGRRFVLADG